MRLILMYHSFSGDILLLDGLLECSGVANGDCETNSIVVDGFNYVPDIVNQVGGRSPIPHST